MIQMDNNKKIKENKYKILRMSLLLGHDTNREETINNFEESAREIDAMNNETYLEELENKFYETKTLEEEQKKLTDLVDYIKGRIYQRESLLGDFINITGKNLMGLGDIKYENQLDEYEERLNYINEYINNTKTIEENSKELEKLDIILNSEEKQKERNESKNEELERALLDKFERVAKNKINIDELTEDNLDSELEEVKSHADESKKSLDIFKKSFETLKNAGISYEEESEYKSYVNSARDIYYDYKETEYLLELYRLLLTNETEYINIYNKREYINSILNDRLETRKELEITSEDKLNDIYKILDNQNEIVLSQKENIDNIEVLKAQIANLKENTKELKEDNEKVEILTILKEYNMVDTYEEETAPEIKFDIPEIDNEPEILSSNEEIKDINSIESEELITNDSPKEPEIELPEEEGEEEASEPVVENDFELPKDLDLNLELPNLEQEQKTEEEPAKVEEETTPVEEEVKPVVEESAIEEQQPEEEKVEEPTEIEVETPKVEGNDLELELPDLEPEQKTEEEPTKVEEETTPVEKEEEKVEEPQEEKVEKPAIASVNSDNLVMNIHDPAGLNVDECLEKANKVMKKVGEMLKITTPEEPKPQEPEKPAVEPPKVEPQPEQAPVEQQQAEDNKPTEEIANPFVEQANNVAESAPTDNNPFVNTEQETKQEEAPNPFLNTEPQPDNNEESNVKNVLPSADDFWNNPQNNNSEGVISPDLDVSNDDFFANSMNDFEFPNLDEFK